MSCLVCGFPPEEKMSGAWNAWIATAGGKRYCRDGHEPVGWGVGQDNNRHGDSRSLWWLWDHGQAVDVERGRISAV